MRFVKLAAVFVAAAPIAVPASAQSYLEGDETINLVCSGDGQKLESQSVDTYEWDKYDDKYRMRSGTETAMRSFQSSVTIQISGGDGRIRLPPTMIPPINSGGDHQHWWQLKDLIVGRDQIAAKYAVNGIVSPKVRIDRHTGDIRITGWTSSFTGTCQKVDPNQNRF